MKKSLYFFVLVIKGNDQFKMQMNDPHTMTQVYDMLNLQPDLQELIKYFYYESIIQENRRKNYKSVIDNLDSAFTNCRQHMQLKLGVCDEDYIINFMIEEYYSAGEKRGFYCQGYDEISLRRVFNNFYGAEWLDYYYQEYLVLDYSDESDQSDDD